MKALLFILGHIVGITLLIVIGYAFNDKINDDYAGMITVLSIGIAIYSTAINILYQKNQRFYLFVNRVLLQLKRTHTYWQPHFHYELNQGNLEQLLSRLWELFRNNKYGIAVKEEETANTLKISLDDLFSISFRVSDNSVTLSFDKKLLVPAHSYNEYRHRLSKLAEGVSGVITPRTSAYSIIVSFKEGEKNPYYGFFVNRVPPELIQDFQVGFLSKCHSGCRIQAGLDCVDIEGDNITDTFGALAEILALKSLPQGA